VAEQPATPAVVAEQPATPDAPAAAAPATTTTTPAPPATKAGSTPPKVDPKKSKASSHVEGPQHTATTTTTTDATGEHKATSEATPVEPKVAEEPKHSSTLIAAVVGGALASMSVILGAAIYMRRRHAQQKRNLPLAGSVVRK